MNILSVLLNEYCVYWPKLSTPDSFGSFSPGTPVQLSCKWKSEKSEAISKDGKVYNVSATVYLSTEVQLDGWLWRGKLANAPATPPNNQIIRSIDRTDDTENQEVLFTVTV